MGMLTPLQEAGAYTLDEVLLHGKALLVEWTGLPSYQITALCNYSETLSVEKPALLEESISDSTMDDDSAGTIKGEGDTEDED